MARLETRTWPAAAKAPVRAKAHVISNLVDGPGRRLLLEMEEWPGSQPGQFVMVGAGAEASVPRRDPLLPRPMAVYRDGSLGRDAKNQAHATAPAGDPGSALPRFEILYRIVGRGTALLAEAEPGDRISLVGPLGRGFPLSPASPREGGSPEAGAGPALLVGGGTGIASLFELAVALRDRGRAVSVLLGARSEQDLMGLGEFESLVGGPDADTRGVELLIATEDGSRGVKGFVTLPLEERLAQTGAGTTVYACGPTPMMRAAADLAARFDRACFVSLENPMACGFGVCLGCAAPRREGGFALVCRQGPVFEASEIAWEGLP
jgi:dihydroorotate dehydrogenase electron transfer subunit